MLVSRWRHTAIVCWVDIIKLTCITCLQCRSWSWSLSLSIFNMLLYSCVTATMQSINVVVCMFVDHFSITSAYNLHSRPRPLIVLRCLCCLAAVYCVCCSYKWRALRRRASAAFRPIVYTNISCCGVYFAVTRCLCGVPWVIATCCCGRSAVGLGTRNLLVFFFVRDFRTTRCPLRCVTVSMSCLLVLCS